MNRRELITAVAAQTVDSVLRGFTDVVCATVAKGDPVVLSGFAKFAKIQTKG
jgi:nucleoid DNA-binding protein